MASLQLPIVLTKLSYLIDNPWTVSLGRANAAGLILADSLIDRNLGVRPITLVGFSLGSRVIFSCLRELANKGAYGLIQNVYLFGSPIVANKDEYLRARMVVSGRFVNGYASNDWILGKASPAALTFFILSGFAGYLFRATSGGIMRIAGLAPVREIPGLENIDVTQLVNGHMAYRAAMPKLLREVGWEVESDEFTEIEDPDPENHEKRQRELIRELDEARKEAETTPGKKRFGFFKRGKLAEKKRWETYDDRMREDDEYGSGSADGGSGNVLFDIEAIKAELASEQIEVKQLESTLPPMKINLNGTASTAEKPGQSPYSSLRETKSYEGSMPFGPRDVTGNSQASLSNGTSSNPFDKGYDSYDDPTSHQSSVENVNKSLNNIHQSPSPSKSSHSIANSPGLTVPAPDSTQAPQRSELRTSVTSPGSTNGARYEHNAWLDDEDEEFGKEKEVKMSFE